MLKIDDVMHRVDRIVGMRSVKFVSDICNGMNRKVKWAYGCDTCCYVV